MASWEEDTLQASKSVLASLLPLGTFTVSSAAQPTDIWLRALDFGLQALVLRAPLRPRYVFLRPTLRPRHQESPVFMRVLTGLRVTAPERVPAVPILIFLLIFPGLFLLF